MNRIVRFLFVAALVPATAHAAAGEDPFADFRIPDHRLFSWTGALGGTASRSDGSTLNANFESGVGNGVLSTVAYRLRDSESRLGILSGRLSASGYRRGEDAESPFVRRELRDRNVNEAWGLGMVERRYPWETPVGFEASIDASGRYQQTWVRDHLSSLPSNPSPFTTRMSAKSRDYEYVLQGSAAIGGGRVRDATGVYHALILEERLRERGALSGPLAPETRQRLAQLFYDNGSYRTILDRPGKTFWARVVEILASDPGYGGRLDPAAVLEALEPYIGPQDGFDFVPGFAITRLRGAFVGLVTRVFYVRRALRIDQSSFQELPPQPPVTGEIRLTQDEDRTDILLGPRAEYHRPIGTRWQVDASSTLLFPTEDFQSGLEFSSGLSAQRIVADRWLAGAYVQHVRSDPVEDLPFSGDSWAVAYGANLDWYMEDRFRWRILASGQQQESFGEFRRFHGVSLSLGYRFAGSLESPGLIEPVRAR